MNDHQNGISRSGTGVWGPPNTTAFVYLAWAILIPVAFAERILNTDGDLASHIFLGRQVMEHGMIFSVDWAHSKPGGTFVAYEWLSEVVFLRLFEFGGLAAVLVAGTLMIATTMAMIAAVLRKELSPLLLLPAVFLVALLTANHWVVRPHLYSFLGLAVLLVLTTRTLSVKHLPLFGALFMIWANLHPGFTYGLIMLGAYLAGDVLDRGWRRGPWLQIAVFAVGAGATLLNPLGWGLHWDIIETMSDRRPFELVAEFRATSPATLAGFVFYATVLMMLAFCIIARRRPRFSTLLVGLAAIFFATTTERHVSLFALYALPLFLWDFAPDLRARIPQALAKTNEDMMQDDQRGKTLPWVALATVVLLGLAATSGRVGPLQVLPNAFSGGFFPVEAVRKAQDAGLENSRFFHSYAWGGYVLHAWPDQQIYIDGMANYFGGDLLDEYVLVNSASPGWDSVLTERGIDAILVRAESPIAGVARDHPDWSVWHEDPTAVILRRR